MSQRVIKCRHFQDDLQQVLQEVSYDNVFLLTDTNSHRYCVPFLQHVSALRTCEEVIIQADDQHKNLETLSYVWKYLCEHGASRKSLLINLGGGMVTDLGGFAAATFKRGIRFINIPTTLLGAVDAAVGGKTGINFEGLKNEIGAFSSAEMVLINADFFKSLDKQNILSGYAEMLKHSLLTNDASWEKILSFNLETIDYNLLEDLLLDSVAVKERIVAEDPFEKGLRKALNLGHTVGHAFESFSHKINCPESHGYAVAWGIVCELYLSYKFCGFDKYKLCKTVDFIKQNYGLFFFNCKHYDQLFDLMMHDKKNEGNSINFTLLEAPGKIKINQTAGKEDIFESLDFYRESFGI
jgi:3-dehydroquinate synthase